MSRNFVKNIEQFAKDEGLELIKFSRKQPKDEITQERLKSFDGKEGGSLYRQSPREGICLQDRKAGI